MAESKYTAPNDFRAFCEMLGETETSMCHHGVKGQKWGIRKYQNMDGSLTAAGRKHYGYEPGRKGKHGDAGEVNDILDESDRKIAQITKNYEFNKEYTLRDPIVKHAISVAKEWDIGRTNDLHINEDINMRSDLSNRVKKGASIGAGVGTLAGIGITSAINAAERAHNDEYNKRADKSIEEHNATMVKWNRERRETEQKSLDRRFENGFLKPDEYKRETEKNQSENFFSYAQRTPTKPSETSPVIPSTFGGLMGAGVGAGIGFATHAAKSIKAMRADNELTRVVNEIYSNKNVDKKTGLKLKNVKMSPDADMSMVNPGYNNWSDGTKSNCLICTATYALRRKGFDVTANGANDGYDTTALLQAFPKATMRRIQLPNTNKNNELSSVLNMPEGGYGNMSVTWKAGGGHSMVVSVEGGRVVVRDTQSNKVYRGAAVNKILSQTTGDARIIRLDNADPDVAQMKKMGMITPYGQTMAAPQLYISNVAGAQKKTPINKHGDTGMVSDALIKAAVTYGAGKLVPMAADAGQKIAGRIKERYEQRKSTKAKT